jgi:hypothetical protein
MGLPGPDAAAYGRDLEAVRGRLAMSAERVAVRGDGLGRFVWAEAAGRSVEVYGDEAGVCVAFWERGADSESHQELHPSYDQAVEAALAWLGS